MWVSGALKKQRISNMKTILFTFLCSIFFTTIYGQKDRHFVIQIAKYDNGENLDNRIFSSQKLKPYGTLVKEDLPEGGLRLILLDRYGKFFTYDEAKKTTQLLRNQDISKAFPVNLLDIPIKSVKGEVMQSDGTVIYVSFSTPSEEGKSSASTSNNSESSPCQKAPYMDTHFFAIQVMSGAGDLIAVRRELKRKFNWSDWYCGRVEVSPVKEPGGVVSEFLYGNYPSKNIAKIHLEKLQDLSNNSIALEDNPFHIIEIGVDPDTKCLTYRNQRKYAIQLACLSQYEVDLQAIQEELAVENFSDLAVRHDRENCVSTVVFRQFDTYKEAKDAALAIEANVDASILKGPFKVVNWE